MEHLTLGLAPPLVSAELMDLFDNKLAAGRRDLTARLTPARAQQADLLIEQSLLERRSVNDVFQLSSGRHETALPGDSLVLPAGVEDPERDPQGLQAALTALFDDQTNTQLLLDLDTPDLQDRRRRLRELQDPSVSHDWLWQISRIHGPVVPREEFQLGLRPRVGAP